MPNQFKSVVIAQLGELPPASRAGREAIYDRLRSELAAMAGPTEQAEHAAALERAIAEVEAELHGGGEAAPATVAATAPPQAESPPPGEPVAARKPWLLAAAAVALVAVLGGGAWYVLTTQQGREAQQAPPSTAVPQRDANADLRKALDPAATDKAKSFQDAMRNADAATAAFLLQSGYRPTRVELRTALLEVRYTRELQQATQSLSPDIRDLACSFATFSDVRRPMIAPRLFDAEDAFAIMKQIGQDTWKSMCAPDAARWRAALARIEQQSAQYNKPDAEKQRQAEACLQRFGTNDAQTRWAEANCDACPESHSNCESYCPKAPKAADADEARFFSFNRSDMQMAAMTSRKQNASRAELYCNLQYLTRSTDFDLANLQRFKSLVGLLE
jgi:hypothetical protein